MTRQPSKKPKPRLSPTLFVADKKRAATGQLESAILLWFNEADPISTLVLASHAARLLSRDWQKDRKAIVASRIYGKDAALVPRERKIHPGFCQTWLHGFGRKRAIRHHLC